MSSICTICINPLNREYVKTPCGHVYCNSCLTEWLINKNTCPECRYKFGDDNFEEEDEMTLSIYYEVFGDFNQPDLLRRLLTGCDKISDNVHQLIRDVRLDQQSRPMWTTYVDPNYYTYKYKTKKLMYQVAVTFNVCGNNINVFTDIRILDINRRIIKKPETWVFKNKKNRFSIRPCSKTTYNILS